jgi:uncharacterized protein YfcZ (UPF0381/DUF406 family)
MATNNSVDIDVCEACGCAGEIGFIIKEGDEVAEVTIIAADHALQDAELAKYIAMAKQVCANVVYEIAPRTENATELHAKFKFEVSAEKLIFELKSRSLSR